jgi:hypothetical protein
MATAAEEEALRPTYFELAAADSLVPSLRAALRYSISVRMGARTRRRLVALDSL